MDASNTKTLYNLKVGTTKYTWYLSKGNTVQEEIVLKGSARNGGSTISFSASTVRYNFVGGKYGTMAAYDGHRHHMPSNSISPLSQYSGPCIRMIKSDHTNTASYGSSSSAKKFREKEGKKIQQGKFLEAQKLGITDVQDKFGTKYNAAINEMVTYTAVDLGYTK